MGTTSAEVAQVEAKAEARLRVYSARTGRWYDLGNGGQGGNFLTNWLGRRRVLRWNRLKAEGKL